MSASEQPWANTEGNALNDKTNAKSSSLDNLLLLLAVLLFAGLCVTLVGIIPVLIMAVGAIQAFRSGDVKNMKVTARFVQSLVILGTWIFGFIGAYKQTDVDDAATRVQAANTAYAPHINEGYMQPYEFSTKLTPAEQHEFTRVAQELWNANDYYRRSKEERNQFLAIAGGISSIALIIEFLWIRPFTRQLPAWQAARALKKTNAKTEKKRIIGRDSLAPYSVADELLKWGKLRQDGLINEDEYQEARKNLLGSRGG
jgi:hypothetical protein